MIVDRQRVPTLLRSDVGMEAEPRALTDERFTEFAAHQCIALV
jgi:hypothetical protein